MRLIDADALSEKLCETTIFIKGGEAFQRMINEATTIDAEPVVRCKDCRFWKNEHLCLVMSRYGSIDTKAEHYCSWGERKEP